MNDYLHKGADALDWDEAMELSRRLLADGRVREAMLIDCGCFLGLRISDLLQLRWDDILSGEVVSVVEQKTSKVRTMKVNPALKAFAAQCREKLQADGDDLIFNSQMYGGTKAMTRQRAAQILAKIARDYDIRSARHFSTHSLRKTFGRRVWLQECAAGNGEVALQLLSDVFGHSSVSITKRYLGIRQDEILSVYDKLA